MIINNKRANIILLQLFFIALIVKSQNIGDPEYKILNAHLSNFSVNNLESGEKQIVCNEYKYSNIIGKYESTKIYWIGLDGICNTISIIEPSSEFKIWYDKLNNLYTNKGPNYWIDKTNNISIQIRSKEKEVILIVYTKINKNEKNVPHTQLSPQKIINKKPKYIGTKKEDDFRIAASKNITFKENGVNRYCNYQNYDGVSECIKYDQNDISIELNLKFTMLEDAETVFFNSETEFPNYIMPYGYINEVLGRGRRLNPETGEIIELLVDKSKNYYLISYRKQ